MCYLLKFLQQNIYMQIDGNVIHCVKLHTVAGYLHAFREAGKVLLASVQ